MHTTLTSRSLVAAGAAALSAALLLSGCSSAAKTASGAPGGTTSAATSTGSAGTGSSPATPTGSTTAPSGGTGATGPVSAAGPVVVRNADKGRTITLHQGQVLQVVLSGGYWPTPASSAPSVLKQSGVPIYLSPSPSAGRGCPPGTGCRPEQTNFLAVTAGTATVKATRTNCGEAMRCTDANGTFTLTVTVVP